MLRTKLNKKMVSQSSTNNRFNKAKIHETEDKMEILKKLITQQKDDEEYLGENLGLIFKALSTEINSLEMGLSKISLESKFEKSKWLK